MQMMQRAPKKLTKQQEKNIKVAGYIYRKLIVLVEAGSGNRFDTKPFDRAFRDVFGVKKFGYKLASARNPMTAISAINELGVKVSFSIVNNREEYYAFADLVQLKARIMELEEKIEKVEKKGGRPKEKWCDTLNKYEKLYKKSCKGLRKMYGICDTEGFKNLSRFIRGGRDYSPFDDDWGYNDPFDFGDGYYDDDEFDDFDLFGGKSGKKLNSQNFGMNTWGSDDFGNLSFIPEDYDDDDDIDTVQNDEIDRLNSRIDKLSDGIAAILTNMTQQPVQQAPVQKPKKSRPVAEPCNDINMQILEQLGRIGNVVGGLAYRLDQVESYFEDDDEFEDEEGFVPADDAATQAEIERAMLGEPDPGVVNIAPGDVNYGGPEQPENPIWVSEYVPDNETSVVNQNRAPGMLNKIPPKLT